MSWIRKQEGAAINAKHRTPPSIERIMRRQGDLQLPTLASHGPVSRTLTVGVSGTVRECCSSQVRLSNMLILWSLLELAETKQ